MAAPSTNHGTHSTSEEREEKLKLALWHAIGQTIDGAAMTQNFNASPRFIGGLSELVFDRIDTAAVDLEAFARHAGRSVIDTSDVLLLGRHNDGLKELLQDEARRVRESGR